jgi:tyrosine phenol-lyase
MIEPTESESQAELDRFCDALIAIRQEIRESSRASSTASRTTRCANAPHTAMVTDAEWSRATRAKSAAFPGAVDARAQVLAAVNRVDNVLRRPQPGLHRMERAVHGLTGMEHILPTHQGRAAERILYGHLGGPGKVFLSNTHFDTTRANIEFGGGVAIDIPIAEGRDPELEHPFKGNIDLEALSEHLVRHGDAVAAVILTVTNNSGGGQPVSMSNAAGASELCRRHGVPLILDCCRVAENSWFVKHREDGYGDVEYREIARRMFDLADGAVMSAKKDALVNMGGFLALRDPALAEACTNLLIITEGFTTYGGLSGRDMEAIAIGLEEVFDPHYLDYRIVSTTYLGRKLAELGVPLMKPIGGHAVYIDAKRLYPHIPVHELPGQALVCELYRLAGIRSVEIGSFMFGRRTEDGAHVPAAMELVRLAIPRRVYTQSHVEYVVETFEEVLRRREGTRGYRIVKEPPFLRHFTAHLEPIA